MAYTVTLTHLCVGQGLSVLLEAVYNMPNGAQERFVALFDLGSSNKGDMYTDALNIILNAVYANGNVLNYVHVSHFDKDHYNLFIPLAVRNEGLKRGKIRITRLVIGSCGILTRADIDKRTECFEGYQVATPIQYLETTSGHRTGNLYTTSGALTYVQDVRQMISTDQYLHITTLLYHAHLFPELVHLGKNVAINTGSSMVLIAIVDGNNVPSNSALFTGDATIHTLKKFNAFYGSAFSTEPKILTIPHHGTKIHIADDNDARFTTLQAFLNIYKPTQAFVSAKCKNQGGWAHPDINVINAYETVVTGVDLIRHQVTAFTYTDEMVVRQQLTYKKIWSTFGLDGIANFSKYEDVKADTAKYQKLNHPVQWISP